VITKLNQPEVQIMKIVQALEDNWIGGTFNQYAKELSTNTDAISQIFHLTLHEEHKIAWRAAYLFDQIHDLEPTMIVQYVPDILERFPNLKNESVKRHYARILAQHDLSKMANGDFLDCCFNWLLLEQTPIAVKAHLMQILFNLTTTYPELIPELKATLEDVIPMGSTGVKNRARKLLAKLN
jgi:hypothetical protein